MANSNKVLVFGNPLIKQDATPIKLLPKLREHFPNKNFIHIDPTENLEQYGPNLTIIDTAIGIKEPKTFILNKNTEHQLQLPKSFTMHDFDLAYNLKLLLKINKIHQAKIICIPENLKDIKSIPINL